MPETWKRDVMMAELSKWMGLVAAIWVQSFAGNTSAYANYSSKLKTVLGLTQVELNYMALAKDFGENVGIIAGLLCNKIPPWIILAVGALEGFFGFGTLWLVVSQTISPRPLWEMCVAICIGGNSMTWFNTAVLVTCMRNFPNNRGTIVGFLKGFIGLSGAIFTQIFFSLLGSDPVRLLLFLAIGPTLVCLISMGFIRPVAPAAIAMLPHEIEKEHQQFRLIHIVCIALAGYLFVAVFLDEFVDDPMVLKVVVGVMLVLLFAPVCVPARVLLYGLLMVGNADEEQALLDYMHSNPDEKLVLAVDNRSRYHSRGQDLKELEHSGIQIEGDVRKRDVAKHINIEDAEILLALGEGAVKRRKRRPRRGEDFKLKQALVKADFWLLFMTFFCGVGTVVTASNNLSQLGQAQGYEEVSTFVLLSCIWGFLGRLGGGSLSEYFIRAAVVPRPVWIAASQALMIVAHLLFAFAMPGSLYIASSILGLCYGVQIAAIVPTASEIFGLKHFGIIYNFITVADPIASLLFSTLLAGNLYDIEVAHQYGLPPHETTDLICTGAHCFRLTFLIMAGICAVGVGLSTVLSVRLKPVYVTLYGCQESTSNSCSSLPSAASYNSLSLSASSSSLPPPVFVFARSPSSASLPSAISQEELH